MNLFTALFLVFLVLKLIGTIAWSWWLVTLPLWGAFAFFGSMAIIAALSGAKVTVRKNK